MGTLGYTAVNVHMLSYERIDTSALHPLNGGRKRLNMPLD